MLDGIPDTGNLLRQGGDLRRVLQPSPDQGETLLQGCDLAQQPGMIVQAVCPSRRE